MVTPPPLFHDYLQEEKSDKEKLNEAANHIGVLEKKVENLSLQSEFSLSRFSNDRKMLQFYTGFTSYAIIVSVFNLLKPTAEKMTRWSQIQRQRSGYSEPFVP